MSKCKAFVRCLYGAGGCCDFIGMERISQVVNNPKGKIKGGICGEFIGVADDRKRIRATDRRCNSLPGGDISEVGESWVYGGTGQDYLPSRRKDLFCRSEEAGPEEWRE